MQLRVDLDLPVGMKDDPTQKLHIRRLADDAILHRMSVGRDAPFTRTQILRWQNPGRKKREDRQWRTGNQADAWTSLAAPLRAALLAARL